jgi:3-hydroxymyristoyl/3-hydroxydecanoyl-(acyl carrier protein) dehydratase
LRDVAAVHAALPAAPVGSQVILVIRSDRYALAVAILAAWARGYVPSLPPELDRDAITMLADAPETATVLHDTASGIPLEIGALLKDAEHFTGAPLAPDSWAELATCAHTFGRTPAGALAPEPWGDAWLEQARTLAQRFAIEPGLRWATSVGSEHPHGIVLGVLWPLLTGGAFLREPLAPSALGAQLAAQAVDVLVSVPAHLPELLRSAAQAPAKPKHVISALEALPASLSEALRAAFGPVLSDLAPAAEQIPVLHCRREARFCSRAEPRASTAAAREDALAMQAERFLRAQAGVRDVAVVSVRADAAPLLCAALVGDGLDEQALRTGLAHELRGAARIALLRLNRIRRDGIGRARAAELLRQFRLRPDGSAVNLALVWGETSTQKDGDSLTQRTRVHVPADYGYFDGHFTGYPILAGAAQLSELVLPCVRGLLAQRGQIRLTNMARLKFTGRIQPGQTIDVVLTMRVGTTTVDFALKRAETLCSAGTLSFAESGTRTEPGSASEEGR